MGGHAGSREACRFRYAGLLTCVVARPFVRTCENHLNKREPDMSKLTCLKEVKQIRKLVVLGILCLCFVNVVCAQDAQDRCQYRAEDINLPLMVFLSGEYERATLHSTGQPVNGVVCDHWSKTSGGRLHRAIPLKNGRIEGL